MASIYFIIKLVGFNIINHHKHKRVILFITNIIRTIALV
jgi:hypothetical protein